MRITQLRLAGQAAWPELAINRFEPELNVFFGLPRTGKSTVAQLAAQLLYGKVEGPWRREFGQSTPLAEGSIEVEAPQGRFLLRRHRDGSPTGRLSIAAATGAPVDGRTVRSLLGELSPRLLAELYAVDFAQPPQPAQLLEGEFAREFSRALQGEPNELSERVCDQHAQASALGVAGPLPAGRHRIDELVRRRDATVKEIEDQLAARRRESGALERELHDVEVALGNHRLQSEQLQLKLRSTDAKLAAIEARLRYFALETSVRRGPVIDAEKHREQIELLDAEIGRCRQTLADLQSREATVRRELAEVHPDGTADSASILADQRAAVGVLERLLDDLDSEVAQLARSHEPGRCLGCDSHARLSPVAQMLRQQLYTLCGQVTEQQRAVRRVHLHAESRQLARAQTDLSEQLEHLLQRRQSLVHEEQLIHRPVVMLPQTPAAAHCQCHGHEQFVRDADAMLLARGDRAKLEEAAQVQRAELERERHDLRQQCDAVLTEIESLQSRWQRLQRERGQAVGNSPIDELRAELVLLEAEIDRVVNGSPSTLLPAPTAPHRHPWKASDVLAQLTDGQLVQIRMGGDSAAARIIDRAGRNLAIEQLSAAQQDQLYVALTLALVSSLSSRGVDLPLFLDEPFLRQDARGAAAMAGVLDEFARQGRQVVVFTEDREVVRRLQSLGVPIQDIDQLRRQKQHAPPPEPVKKPAAETPKKAPPEPATTRLRLVRETVGDRKPQLRVAGQWTRSDEEPEVYYLDEDASIADFPVLGNETASAFERLGVKTVHDLLVADATDVAERLNRPNITAEAVRLWQVHMSLMCFVPGLSLNDAQVLAASDIGSPEALYTSNVRLLAEAVERFLTSERGRRFAALRQRFTQDRLAELQQQARSQRQRWQVAAPQYSWIDRPMARVAAESRPHARSAKRTPAVKLKPAAKRTASKPLRFFLGRTSPVVEAPSIGPKAAERLNKVGIRTVADLLNANPQSTAEEIAEPRLTAEVITRWQQEARLACRIPELRDCGARLLVAAGFTDPSQIAGIQPAELVERIRTLCRRPEGKRLLHDGKAPTTARIEQWARNAAHGRPLEAA